MLSTRFLFLVLELASSLYGSIKTAERGIRDNRYICISRGGHLQIYDTISMSVVDVVEVSADKEEISAPKLSSVGIVSQKVERADLGLLAAADKQINNDKRDIDYVTDKKKKEEIYNKREEDGSIERQRIKEKDKTENKTKKKVLIPQTDIIGQKIVVHENRIAIEYVQIEEDAIVLIYNDLIRRTVHILEKTERVSRELKCAIKGTYISRKHFLCDTIDQLYRSYPGSILYVCKYINGYFYLSEIYRSEIKKTHEELTRKFIDVVSIFVLFIISFFSLFSVFIRIYVKRSFPIKIAEKKYSEFKEAILFRNKPVYVLEIDKKTSDQVLLYRNLLIMRGIEPKSSIVYTEETEDKAYIAYSRNISSVAELFMEWTREKKCAVVFSVLKKIEEIHGKGYAGVSLTLKNVFIREVDQNIIFTGLNELKKFHPEEKESLCTKDYQEIGLLFLELIENPFLLQTERKKDYAHRSTILYAQRYIKKYRFTVYPQFTIGSRAGCEVEALDCISMLLEDSQKSYRYIATHPVFWSAVRKFEFLSLFSDYIFDHPQDRIIESSRVISTMDIDQSNWDVYIDIDLLSHLIRYGKYYYNTRAIRDLYRLIRNNGRHFQSIPLEGREYFSNTFGVYIKYFLDLFPYLILLAHTVCEEQKLFDKKIFHEIKYAIHM